MAKAKIQRPNNYGINIKIRDMTEGQLKEYAQSQEMTVTDLLNAAAWYCREEKIDLAIWAIKARRKLKEKQAEEQI